MRVVCPEPRLEGGHYHLDIYTLELSNMSWSKHAAKGRWSVQWNAEASIYLPDASLMIQFGKHPVSNFSTDTVMNSTALYTSNSNNSWVMFTNSNTQENSATVVGITQLTKNRLLVTYTSAFDMWNVTYDTSILPATRVVTSTLPKPLTEYVSAVTVGDNMFLFDMCGLSKDRLPVGKLGANNPLINSKSTINTSLSVDMRFVANTGRAPSGHRIGASIVHYDGYIIFFGGSRDVFKSSHTNELHVLSIGTHQSIETILDQLEIADSLIGDQEDEDLQAVIEISKEEAVSKKKKKKRPARAVKFEDEEDNEDPRVSEKEKIASSEESDSSSAEERKKLLMSDDKATKEELAISIHSIGDDAPSPPPPPPHQIPDSRFTTAKIDLIKPTKPVEPAKPPAKPSPDPKTEPEAALLHWLEENQASTHKLLGFALDNPDAFPDIAFKVENRIFWAHKAIICARSSRWSQKLAPVAPKSSKTSSPGFNRRSQSDIEDSQLDVSTESAMPAVAGKGSTSALPSPFMFSRLGSGAIDLMLEEDDKLEEAANTVLLPPRYSTLEKTLKRDGLLSSLLGDDIPVPPGASIDKISASSSANNASATPSSSSASPSPASSSDSVVSAPSNSGIAPPAKSVQLYHLEDLSANAFMTVLRYMYTGYLSLLNVDREAVADVAFEFLIDEVSSACRDTSTLSYTEPMVKVSRMLRRIVGSQIGSDYFFVVRRKKLFAHRFLILLFSSHLRKVMLSRIDKSYVEIREVEELNIPVEAFIDFCRMMYSNFTSRPEHAEKKMDTAAISKLAVQWDEYRCLVLMRSSKPDAASTLDLFRLVSGKKNPMLRDVRRWIIMHFSRFVQDKKVISSLTRAEQLTWRHLGELGGASHLDVMWFAHALGDTKLLSEAENQLGTLINVENVLPVLFGAHQTGLKALRSLCMDFMTAHSTSIEDARRMQVDAPVALGKVAGLSASLNHELTNKLTNATSGGNAGSAKVKRCGSCTKSFSTFGKKSNCALCHKTTCSDCTRKKQTIPPIFGFSKPKDICPACAQVVDIWTDPATKSAAPAK